MLGFDSSIAAAAVPAWHEMINGPADRKLALLADPEWRGRARHDWDHPLDEQNSFRKEQLHLFILSDSENGTGPDGRSRCRTSRRQRGAAPVRRARRLGARERHRVAVHEARGPARHHARDGRSVVLEPASTTRTTLIGGTDAGAHLKMFCGAGGNLYVLTHWVRDEAARSSIEQAVHCMTQRNASFFSLHDRGVLDVGKRGDLAVFALDEIETRELRAGPRPARRRMAVHPAERGLPGHGRRRRAHRARRQAHRRAPHHDRQRGLRPACSSTRSDRPASMTDDLLDDHDALGLAALVREREITATELVEAAIAGSRRATRR